MYISWFGILEIVSGLFIVKFWISASKNRIELSQSRDSSVEFTEKFIFFSKLLQVLLLLLVEYLFPTRLAWLVWIWLQFY